MKNLLRLEEFAQFAAAVAFLYVMNAEWWAYLLLFLGPDISMLGYLINTRVGAFTYNLFHHKAVAIIVFALGYYLNEEIVILAGAILFGHASMDRIFGYGLKYGDSFHHTHLTSKA